MKKEKAKKLRHGNSSHFIAVYPYLHSGHFCLLKGLGESKKKEKKRMKNFFLWLQNLKKEKENWLFVNPHFFSLFFYFVFLSFSSSFFFCSFTTANCCYCSKFQILTVILGFMMIRFKFWSGQKARIGDRGEKRLVVHFIIISPRIRFLLPHFFCSLRFQIVTV